MRCKFSCRTNYSGEIVLEPVYSGSEENRGFFRGTPGGHIKLTIPSPATHAFFQSGHDYYVDFTAPKEGAPDAQ